MLMEQRFKQINEEKRTKFNKMSEVPNNEYNKKTELINDLAAVVTIMEDYWRFHPANENQLDIVKEYAQLEAIKDQIELDIKKEDVKNQG